MCLFQNQIINVTLVFLSLVMMCDFVSADVVNDAVEAGKKEYARSCELCHGISGKGDGPYASRLIVKPADLTILAKLNNGTIPIANIYRMIDGSGDIAVHGGSSMPIWGNRYRSESTFKLEPDSEQTFVRGRIFELLIYLDTLQVQ